MKVLVIGGGYIGQVHLDQYKRMPGIEIAGLVDSRPEASQVARKYNINFYHSVEEVKAGDFDVVDIDVPTVFHKEYAFWACNLGKHIICEKPLARDVKDAASIVDKCKENNVRLFVGLVLRYYPEYIKAKKIVESGAIGTPCTASTWRGGSYPNGQQDWYADRGKSGGTVFDLALHDFDFLRWTLGPVEQVFCRQTSQKIGRIDYSVTVLKFKSGAISDTHGFWSHGNFRTKFEIAGTEGLIVNDSTKNQTLYATSAYTLTEDENDNSYPDFIWKYDPMYKELEDFIESIEKKKQASVTELDALEAVKISSAAEQSAKTGNPVFLEEVLE